MLTTFLPYVKCLVPFGVVALLILGHVLVQRIIAATIISRPIPQGGFASVEDEIRYVNDQPAETRRHIRYRAWIIFIVVFCVIMPLSYIVPTIILKMANK